MGVVTLKVPESQLVEWIRQLSPAGKQAVLAALIPNLDRLEWLGDYGRERIRAICADRGLDWDRLDDPARERLIDDLLHEA
jgi:hypothetical protein